MVGSERKLRTLARVFTGSAIFALGFDLFLLPNALNAGGLSGLSMVIVSVLGTGSVGSVAILLNLPLFAIAGLRIGKRFVLLSLVGMLFSAVFLDLFAGLPAPAQEPILGAVYGGFLCGLGIGMVFAAGGSTGGSDIVIRLLKQRWRGVPIGTLAILFDLSVAAITGFVFRDIACALYSGIAVFVSGQVVDAVVYRFDYSRVVLIISQHHELIAQNIASELGRGATFLNGEGSYSHRPTKVVLTAVRRQQLPRLKEIVVTVDPAAFMIVQEAHQILGDGFLRYSKETL